MMELTPRQIVAELDKYIIGQQKAKRSVAVALRNRFRRRRLDPAIRDEVMPKNILMIGPTGVGKTEIARRLARLADAPFIKVEATKFTEVGYVGRDVESIIRDLVEISIRMIKSERMAKVADKAEKLAEERLVEILAPIPKKEKNLNPLSALLNLEFGQRGRDDDELHEEQVRKAKSQQETLRTALARGEMENQVIEIEVDDSKPSMLEIFTGSGVEEMGVNLQELLGGMVPKKKKKRRVTVAEARKILAQEEAQKLIDMDEVTAEAIARAEAAGIVFVDEIDKIAGRESGAGPDVSREGVQRDILPIVEGSTVMTKYGPVKTDHMLFIAAGAFHVAKPSDLIPELQGRFPIRVELESLSEEDFCRILTEPQNALVKQYTALLETEGVKVNFTDDAIKSIAKAAFQVNERTENIGARRLHTIMERLLEDLSFDAPDLLDAEHRVITIDARYVEEKLGAIVKSDDLSRFIL
ncbi:MAG: ATP-dependent protease ATPase subunit HslU [Syntrophothermus sp.]